MADDDPSEIHLHWEPPSENLIHRGGVDIKWNGPLALNHRSDLPSMTHLSGYYLNVVY